jgi:CDP-paratose 2-epimerase
MKTISQPRNVLIFGGAGFIGSNWAHWLLRNTEANIHIFDNLSRRGVRYNLESLREEAGKSGRLEVTIADVRDATAVGKAVRPATEIYHFAAQVAVTTSLSDPRLDYEVNLGGTFNILEAVRQAGNHPFFLFTSTNKVYGELDMHPLVAETARYRFKHIRGIAENQPLDFHSPYGCSKGAADQYVHDYARMFGIPAVVFRMSCIAGPRQFGNEDQGWVAHFLYSAIQQIPLVIYGDGRQVRDVLCVDDLVCAFEAVRINTAVTRGQVYNLGGGMENTTSLLELMDEIEELTGRPVEYVLDDRRPGDQLVYITDYSKLHRDTGWKPKMSVRQTLMRIEGWWKENHTDLVPDEVRAPLAGATLQNLPGAA